MAEYKKKKGYFYTTTGSVVLALVLMFIMQVVLHRDFWNWGEQNIYFGWITGEYLYRLFLICVGAPLTFTIIEKISWPMPK